MTYLQYLYDQTVYNSRLLLELAIGIVFILYCLKLQATPHSLHTIQASSFNASTSQIHGVVPCVPPYCHYECQTEYILPYHVIEGMNYELLQRTPTPLVCQHKNTTLTFHPIVFGVIDDNMISTQCMPRKELVMAPVVAGRTDTYKFGWQDEYDYYRSYRISMFGHTKKKAGWDCNRHYEIISQGAAPWFDQLEQSNQHTMMHLPKDLLLQIRDLLPEYTTTQSTVELPSSFDHGLYWQLLQRLMHYTANRLTTTALARYMLQVSNNDAAQQVLFVSHTGADYMKDQLLHGFTKLYGHNCTTYLPPQFLYSASRPGRMYPEPPDLYGKGFSYRGRLESYYDCYQRDAQLTMQDVQSRIRAHEFDVIIFGSIHRENQLLPYAVQHYDRQHILMLDGEDIQTGADWHERRINWAKQGTYFLREFNSDVDCNVL